MMVSKQTESQHNQHELGNDHYPEDMTDQVGKQISGEGTRDLKKT